VAKEILCLPIYADLTEDDQAKVIAAIRDTTGQNGN
jgi:dTDP-4-amino-4,6-dideoxygalactose transaminase